jgi:hypothetical protein
MRVSLILSTEIDIRSYIYLCDPLIANDLREFGVETDKVSLRKFGESFLLLSLL